MSFLLKIPPFIWSQTKDFTMVKMQTFLSEVYTALDNPTGQNIEVFCLFFPLEILYHVFEFLLSLILLIVSGAFELFFDFSLETDYI